MFYFVLFQAEIYVNLLEGESVDEDSLTSSNSEESPTQTSNSDQFCQENGGKTLVVDESDESSVTTLSTIQSRHVTPMATPSMSKVATPRSSFTTHDRLGKPSPKAQNSFDLGKKINFLLQNNR